MGKLKEYDVEWCIQVSASSPVEAAKQCRAIQLDPNSLATVFHVTDELSTEEHVIDLEEHEHVES